MGLFGNLMGKIFGKDDDDAKKKELEIKPMVVEAGADHKVTLDPGTPQVDITALLDNKETAHPENLEWRKSIVDLMKLYDMDSSYGNRKELALELGYSQERIDKDGSAEMNMWLHKRIMGEIAQNGGNVPSELYA